MTWIRLVVVVVLALISGPSIAAIAPEAVTAAAAKTPQSSPLEYDRVSTSTTTPADTCSSALPGYDEPRIVSRPRTRSEIGFLATKGASGASTRAAGRIDPSEVRFSQSSASARFRDGGTIDDLARGLRSGRVDPSDVPAIRLGRRGETSSAWTTVVLRRSAGPQWIFPIDGRHRRKLQLRSGSSRPGIVESPFESAAADMELHEQVDSISTREDLIAFVERLRDDFGAATSDWENTDILRYLDALAAWTADMDGYFENRGEPVPEAPTWRLVAQMLLAAKHYE